MKNRKAPVDFITAERLRYLFHYDPATGLFTRVVPRRGVPAGAVVGCLDAKGYMSIHIDYRRYLGHRLAWLYVTGCWPADQVDHIDGDKANNRWQNLREATGAINSQNRQRATVCNRLGVLGVSQVPSGRFKAYIKFNGKSLVIGSTYQTAAEAHAAYIDVKRRLHPGNTL